MNLLLNILGYILLFFSIELFLYIFCILLTIKEEEINGITFNNLFEDIKEYNRNELVDNKFKGINIIFIITCILLAIFGISIFFITKS